MLELAAASLLPVFLLGLIQIREEGKAARERAEMTAMAVARIDAAEVTRRLGEAKILLAELANHPLVQAMDPAHCDPAFTGFHTLHPQYANLLTKRLDGTPVCSSRPIPPGAKLDPRNYLDLERLKNGLSVGRANVGAVSSRWVVPLDYPIRDASGRLIGTVDAPLDLLTFNPFLMEGTARPLPEDMIAALLSADVVVLGRSREPEKWIGATRTAVPDVVDLVGRRSGIGRFVSGIDGIERVYAASPVAGTDWVSIAGLPAAPIDARIRGSILKWLSAELVTLALSLGTAWYLSRRPSLAMAAATAADRVAIQRGEERFRSTFEQAAVGIAHVDLNGRVIYANRRFGEIVGRPPGDLVGLDSRHLTHPEDVEASPSAYQRLVSGLAERTVWEKRYVRPDGTIVWARLTASMVHEAGGSPRYIIVDIEDISEQRVLEQHAQRLQHLQQAILDAAGNAVIATDADGWVSLFNPAAETLLGYDASDVVGRMTPDAFHDPDEMQRRAADLSEKLGHPVAPGKELFVELLKRGGAPHVDQWTYRRKDNSRVPVLLSVSPLPGVNGGPGGFLGLAQDISRLKALEEELTRSNRDLEHFAYIASHDLRQPLRMVMSYLGLIERKLDGVLEGEVAEFFEFAINGARRMDAMINGLLEYSRVGRGKPRFESVAIGDAVADAVALLDIVVHETGGRVTVAQDLPVVEGDRSELIRLFQNLIGNALKYGVPDRPPEVRIETRAGSGAERVIAVADNGRGIAAENFERIFSMFQRLVRDGEVEGTGIGLTVCRRIVEHHGGRIWLDSALGVGTTFFIALPAPKVSPPG